MAHDEHAPHLENIPAYAIGALDADETAALEMHLTTCASCQTELAEYRALSASLLTAVPPSLPSPALRKRLQKQLPSARKSPRPSLTFSFSRLALGLSIIALLLLNLYSIVQLRQVRDQQTRLLNQAENAQVVLALLSSPNVQMFPFRAENVSGTFLLDSAQDQAVLITWDIPELGLDQTYQIWLIQPDGARVSAGLFRPESGQDYTTQTISAWQILSKYVGIGVTVEPAGGSEQPTGTRVFKVDF